MRPLLPVLLLLLALGGCRTAAPNAQAAPEAAFRAFADALRAGDHETVWAFLEDPWREHLDAVAARHLALTSESRHPASFLAARRVPVRADLASVERAVQEEERTVLLLETYLGERAEVEMLRTEQGWRVHLGPPPTAEEMP